MCSIAGILCKSQRVICLQKQHLKQSKVQQQQKKNGWGFMMKHMNHLWIVAAKSMSQKECKRNKMHHYYYSNFRGRIQCMCLVHNGVCEGSVWKMMKWDVGSGNRPIDTSWLYCICECMIETIQWYSILGHKCLLVLAVLPIYILFL